MSGYTFFEDDDEVDIGCEDGYGMFDVNEEEEEAYFDDTATSSKYDKSTTAKMPTLTPAIATSSEYDESTTSEVPTLTPAISVDNHRDWNDEWQRAIVISDRVERACESVRVLVEFEKKITTIVKEMVEDLSLPYEKRRYVIQTKGIAGGDKYRYKNIFLKFVRDTRHIYRDDAFAAKAAQNERKGLSAYYNLSTDLAVPMFAVVTYLGWRIIATPVLPIQGQQSLVYGSDDQGRTVRNSNPKVNHLMMRAAKKMNIKPHRVGSGDQMIEISSCCDIEVHYGSDKRLYLLDTGKSLLNISLSLFLSLFAFTPTHPHDSYLPSASTSSGST
jgi:hypothetical protein